MRLLTYNLCALPVLTGDIPRRLELAARAIAALDPDVIVLQEVFLAGQLERLRAGLAAWPHLAWRRLSFSRVAGGICVLSKRPIRAWGFQAFRVQGSLWRMSALVHLNPKGFLWADLDGMHLVHTHLLADYRISRVNELVNPYHALQRSQLDEVGAHLRGRGEGPVIVAGDLNMKPQAPVLTGFLAAAGLTDPMAGAAEPSVIDEPYYRIPFFHSPGKRLDYVLHRGFAGAAARLVLGERVLGARTLSDHLGVLAELRR